MSKNRTGEKRWTPAGRPGWLVATVLGIGVLLLAGGLWWGLSGTSANPVPGFTPQASGPRLAVDRDLTDLGVQPLNRKAYATFQVSDVGSSPLQILGEPAVELVQGC
jgi:hypothetical protein